MLLIYLKHVTACAMLTLSCPIGGDTSMIDNIVT